MPWGFALFTGFMAGWFCTSIWYRVDAIYKNLKP